MPKPLYATPEMINSVSDEIDKKVAEFKEKLRTGALSEGTIEFKQNYKWPDREYEKPLIEFTPEAWAKMDLLVMNTSTEIGWHGTVDRLSDTHFRVTDIMVYPQTVTGSFIDSDDDKLIEWRNSIPFAVRSKMKFHGHSHVNMSPCPSGTDISNRKTKFIDQFLSEEDYYIFIIMNKSHALTLGLYDMRTNAVYDEKECEVKVTLENGMDLFDWCNGEKSHIEEKKHTPQKQDKPKTKQTKEDKNKEKKENIKSFPAPSKKISRYELNVTDDAVRDLFNCGYYIAHQAVDALLVLVNEGEIANEKETLLCEAEGIVEELSFDDINWRDGNSYGYSYGYNY